jgi:small GTP-binding protein
LGKFDSRENQTIGVAYEYEKFEASTNKVELNIWDTAGQERNRSLDPGYLNGANVAILVFDITSCSSFYGLEDFTNSVRVKLLQIAYCIWSEINLMKMRKGK